MRYAIAAAGALWILAGIQAMAATACCRVTEIAPNGQVTAREINGSRTIRFQVRDARLLRGMKPGAPVYANFEARQVSLDGKTACCKIVDFGPAAPSAPAGQSGSAASAAAANIHTQALDSDVLALQSTADLVARNLGFTALAEITFDLVNRGQVPINVHAKSGSAGAAAVGAPAPASGPPIAIDVWLGTSKIAIQQPAMGAGQTKNFKVPIPSNYPKPKCLESRNLKVVVDPQNGVEELYDDNNVTEAMNSPRPCPDLAIKSIKRDYGGVAGETYRVKVTVVNLGNAPAPSNQVWATSLPGGPWPISGWPELVPTQTIPALDPGETKSFKVGGDILATTQTSVRIILDRFYHIDESDESNNFKDDQL